MANAAEIANRIVRGRGIDTRGQRADERDITPIDSGGDTVRVQRRQRRDRSTVNVAFDVVT